MYADGLQLDRLGHLYLGDVEVWRTSTALPKPGYGVYWEHWKDMTQYLSLWKQKQKIIFDFGTWAGEKPDGWLNVTFTATFFHWKNGTWPNPPPADVVLPVSAVRSGQNEGSAFVYPRDGLTTIVHLPQNLRRATIAIGATAQGEDEFWWTNAQNSTKPGLDPANKRPWDKSAYREISVFIDGFLAGIIWPIPFIFNGGIAPTLHRPIASAQAFDILEQELDLSPFLPVLADGRPHNFTLAIHAVDERAVPAPGDWTISAKLFLWLDPTGFQPQGSAPQVLINDFSLTRNGQNKDERFEKLRMVDRENPAQSPRNSSSALVRWFALESQVFFREGTQNLSSEQTFSGLNVGFFDNVQFYHNLAAVYTATQLVKIDGALTKFYNSYEHPLELLFVPGPATRECASQFNVFFSQKLTMTTNGETAFPSLTEAWMRIWQGVYRESHGRKTFQYRKGFTSYCQRQDAKTLLGNSWTRAGFKLAPTDYDTQTIEWSANPLFYRRTTSAVNSSIDYDESYTYKLDKPYEFEALPALYGPMDWKEFSLGEYGPVPDTMEGKWRSTLGKFVNG